MATKTTRRPLTILLVEDSPTDTLMTREAFEQVGLLDRFHTVEDGVAALAFLHREAPYTAVPRPDLILLDLNLPQKNGQEVLAELRADQELKLIPVIILATSQAQEDILNAYGLYANCYITKPVGFAGFVEVARAIRRFWAGVATLPGGG
jgi:CheY-like chemotaxis protein